jgi:hypothetical protein
MTASVSPRAFDEANNISAELENVVVLDGLWSIRLAVSALVFFLIFKQPRGFYC